MAEPALRDDLSREIWLPAPRRPILPANGEIAVFRVDLAAGDGGVGLAAGVLSADEQARADRFRFAGDRRRFVIARASLRLLLAGTLGKSAEAIRFGYGPAGKPALAGEPALCFNVSHSDDLALIAIAPAASPDMALGIDVERLRPVEKIEALVLRCFNAAERAAWQASPCQSRSATFFRLWARKEARLKAAGCGLAGLEVAGEDLDDASASHWLVEDLAIDPRFAAALATSCQPTRIHRWIWQMPRGPVLI